MWRPPERIKHPLPEAAWPTRERAARALLFRPLTRGRLRLADRTWVPAMVPWRASAEGFVTPAVLAWYERFARGAPAVLVVEATGVRDVPSGPLLRVGHDRFLPGLCELVRVVREASAGRTRLFLQIIDFLAIRRRPPLERYLGRFLAITDRHRQALRLVAAGDDVVRARLATLSREELERVLTPRERDALDFGYRELVTDLHLPHIAELPQVLPAIFVAAAVRAEAAGFAGVELHYAHAYTMASFLSATNTRDDGYGGALAHRVRLPLEVHAAVRAAVSDDFVVGCRYLADECIAVGSSVPDAVWFGVELARAGMDFLSLSRGGKFDDAKQPEIGAARYPYTGPSGYECMPTVISDARGPFGRNLYAVAMVRSAVRAAGLDTPIVASGGIGTFAAAEAALASGQADIVGAARQSLADPDWFLKMRLGRGSETRRCEYTNYCEALDQRHREVTCKLWDRVDRDEAGIMLSADGRRRLIAPAWPARSPA